MKFLQLSIFSFNTSLTQFWLHQLQNNYIFLQETNYKEGILPGSFKYWKVRMRTIFKNMSLLSVSVSRDDLIRDDLEIAWNEIKDQGKKSVYRKYLYSTIQRRTIHTLDKVLESLNNDTITLLGDFIATSTVWDKHTKQNTKLEAILEDIIQHSLYIAADIGNTHHWTSCEESHKSIIHLTLARGLQNQHKSNYS